MTYSYILMEVQLEYVFEEKDLGIIINIDLTFDVHVSDKIKKANNNALHPGQTPVPDASRYYS